MGKVRDLSKEHFWRRTLGHWQRSGLSVAAFCAREGLDPCSLYWWRRELTRRDQQAVSFVPVQLSSEPSGGAAGPRIEIAVTGGRRLLIHPGFDHETLRQVLRVLEEPAC